MNRLQAAVAAVGLMLLILGFVSQLQGFSGHAGFLGHSELFTTVVGAALAVAALVVLATRTAVFRGHRP